jgi:hypothetical protein
VHTRLDCGFPLLLRLEASLPGGLDFCKYSSLAPFLGGGMEKEQMFSRSGCGFFFPSSETFKENGKEAGVLKVQRRFLRNVSPKKIRLSTHF